ncbi:MAG: tRNA 5-methoxyuridine(34)/uridine 5-oxyacetic acid(34) synthase CmoB [Woeseiaceae bacterium]|nr:tRNA 5-methoxyuridine(34)/uridine 5-oxyacetic acid(34) synthase CmoB [Woeseiaceae bacterium]
MIVDSDKLARLLSELDLDAWRTGLESLIRGRLSPGAHGNLQDWEDAIERLPIADVHRPQLNAPSVSVELDTLSDESAFESALKLLMPWRKGPFRLGPIEIDTEWRCDMKWSRLEHRIASLEGRHVLDIGCGNGYYAYRMIGAGARLVFGADPTLLYIAQFAALSRYLPSEQICVLPLRLEELPAGRSTFDTVFSMGVLYHQRSPLGHLRQIRSHLRSGGELVLETLILPGDEAMARTPENRYARMRNVWLLPTLPELTVWLSRCGFRDIELIDVTETTTDEQRSTDWMNFESLSEALDPDDPSMTVEGWPAPRRAILKALAP